MDTTPIVVEQRFDVPIELVWNAITEQAQMQQWFFDSMIAFKPEVGFETQFNVRCADRDFLHHVSVIEVTALRRISYRWRYGGYPGDSTVTWELSQLDGGTHLGLTHAGQATFPQDDPVFSRDSCEAGWRYFLHDRLTEYLGTSTS